MKAIRDNILQQEHLVRITLHYDEENAEDRKINQLVVAEVNRACSLFDASLKF